jgi:hypothetical protein
VSDRRGLLTAAGLVVEILCGILVVLGSCASVCG